MNRSFSPYRLRVGFASGFTLVELLLVILILSSLALVTTFLVDNMNEQFRFDQTKSRLEQIRRAIIGDSARTLNGESEISGFIADMGRLPESLSELVEPPSDPDQLWGEQEVALSGVTVYLYGGWRGPYLETFPESDSGENAFRDGWGNPDLSGVEANYGWNYELKELSSVKAAVTVQSLGADGIAGPPADPDNPYQKDYPMEGHLLVNEPEWHTNLKGHPVRVRLNRATTSADALDIQIYFLKGGVKQLPVLGDLGTTLSGVASQDLNGNFDNDEDAYIPLGTHLAVVVCAGTDKPYDGNCPGTGASAAKSQFIKIIPRSYTPPLQIEWNAQ